jgi:chromosome segregation ATPase
MADAPDLDKLKADLKKLQNDIAALSKQAAAAQAAVKTAEAELAEIAKTADVYDTSGPKMQNELDDDKTVIAKKRPIAELEVKDLKQKLDKRTEKFDEDLKKDGDAATAAANKAKQAAADADQAVKDLQDKQAAFASLKDQPKATAAKLKELKGLLNEVAKAEAQDDSVAMYFNVVEATALAEVITIPAPKDYRKQVVDALADIEKGKETAAKKKADFDKANTAAADARKKHQAALASRRSDLLKALREVKPGP